MSDKIPGTKFIIFALLCLVAAGWVASVSGNIARDRILPTLLPFLDDANHYEAQLEEASGLVVGDDVRVAGVDVGRVNSIRLERGSAVVSFEVDAEVVPTTEWEAGARWRNALGQRFLYLYPNPGGTPLEQDDRIPLNRSRRVADLSAFVNEITPLLEAIDPAAQNKLTQALNEVLVGREQDIQSLVTNLSELAGTLADQEPQIRSVIANANALLTEYNSREDQLTAFVDQLALVSDTLANRNGELLDAALDLADVQEQLGALIDANDDNIAGSLSNIRRVTESIRIQRDAFEDAIASLRMGLASYVLTSRDGEWFNVRGVAIQVQQNNQVVSCETETSTPCSFPNAAGNGQPAGSAGSGGSAGTVVLSPERRSAIEVVTGVPLLRSLDGAGEGG